MFTLPLKVAALMDGFKPHWFVAGGWAIDLFLGKVTRPHEDIEIAIFRKDQIAVQKHLRDWNLKTAANGKLLDWKETEFLESPIHAVHCFSEKNELSFLEILLNEFVDDKWLYRRNVQITKPLPELYLTSVSDIRILCPEVVLLYKSKNSRAKDEQDFENTTRFLTVESRNWLADALRICDSEHRWLKKLESL